MHNKEIMLIGFDIYKLTEEWCRQKLTPSLYMTQGEEAAYELGIANTLDILCELVNVVATDGDDNYNNIPVHVKGLQVMEEFATIEEIEEKLEQMERETL